MPLENFFGSTVPAGFFEEGSTLSLGTRFTVNATGVDCTGARWYVGPSGVGSITAKLYRNSDQLLLASATLASPVSSAWNEVTWSGVHLGSGLAYTIVWVTSNRYPATASFGWPVSTPSGKATTHNPAGYFGSGDVYPTTVSGNAANYFPDPILSYTSSTTPVSSAMDFRWQVSNVVSAPTDLRWQVSNTVSKASDFRWSVLSPVSKALDARWQVSSAVSSAMDFRWVVSSGAATPVSSSVDVRWAVLSTVSAPLDARWQVLNAVSRSLDLRWAQLAIVSAPLDVRWAVAGNVSRSIALQWQVLSPVSATLDLRWGFTSQISRSLDLRWTVLNQVARPVTLLWVTGGSTVRLVAMAVANLTDRFSATPEPEHIVADLVER